MCKFVQRVGHGLIIGAMMLLGVAGSNLYAKEKSGLTLEAALSEVALEVLSTAGETSDSPRKTKLLLYLPDDMQAPESLSVRILDNQDRVVTLLSKARPGDPKGWHSVGGRAWLEIPVVPDDFARILAFTPGKAWIETHWRGSPLEIEFTGTRGNPLRTVPQEARGEVLEALLTTRDPLFFAWAPTGRYRLNNRTCSAPANPAPIGFAQTVAAARRLAELDLLPEADQAQARLDGEVALKTLSDCGPLGEAYEALVRGSRALWPTRAELAAGIGRREQEGIRNLTAAAEHLSEAKTLLGAYYLQNLSLRSLMPWGKKSILSLLSDAADNGKNASAMALLAAAYASFDSLEGQHLKYLTLAARFGDVESQYELGVWNLCACRFPRPGLARRLLDATLGTDYATLVTPESLAYIACTATPPSRSGRAPTLLEDPRPLSTAVLYAGSLIPNYAEDLAVEHLSDETRAYAREAEKWLTLAYANGHKAAPMALAILIEQTSPVQRALVYELYRQTAEQGDPHAQFCLGFYLLYGLPNGLPTQPAVGHIWIDKAAEQGYPAALLCQGTLLTKEGKRDQAIAAFEAAAKASPRSYAPRVHLAASYLACGKPDRALDTLHQADPDALRFLVPATAYLLILREIYTAQPTNALRDEVYAFHQRLCDASPLIYRSVWWGSLIHFAKQVNDTDTYLKWLTKAAKDGQAAAQWELGIWNQTAARNDPANAKLHAEAAKWLKAAAEKGYTGPGITAQWSAILQSQQEERANP